MDNDNLTPLSNIFEQAAKEIERTELPKIQKRPNFDYFPISESHITQRLLTTDAERAKNAVETYNKNHPEEAPKSLLSFDVGITGTGDTDRALFVIANMLNQINLEQGDIFGNGYTEKIKEYIVKRVDEADINLSAHQTNRILISFPLSEFARKYYDKAGKLSGGEITRALEVLRKLDNAYYLFFNENKGTIILRKYITLPQIEFNGRAKNITLTLEIDPYIFAINKGDKFAIVGAKFFGIYKNANHFHIQFLTKLLDVCRLNNSRKKRSPIFTSIMTRNSIFKCCATFPKYKKNPQYKEIELKEAIELAKQLGVIIACEDTQTAGGESAIKLTLNSRYYTPNNAEITAAE